MRNTRKMIREASPNYAKALEKGLMQLSIRSRKDKTVTLPDGRDVVEFINCSYLGLDTHPQLIAAAQQAVEEWGVHLCCARSRFTIDSNRVLEEELSALFGGRAITFPSVTSAHMSTMPLLAAGVLLPGQDRPARIIFDRFSHASMQFLKPILAAESEVVSIGHNDLERLVEEVLDARESGEQAVYVADGVYSMGGVAPLREVLALAEEYDFYLYIDDAHGTSILGDQGEGYALWQTGPTLHERMILTYSLAKGFGCNGGGVLVPEAFQERAIRSYGVTYGFSAPLDFSVVGAARASAELHRNGTIKELQSQLWTRVRHFAGTTDDQKLVSPIAMVPAPSAERCLEYGAELRDRGFFVSVVFFPIVARDKAQLRLCISASHTIEQLDGLKSALDDLGLKPSFGLEGPRRPVTP